MDHIRTVLRARYKLEDEKADQAIIEITEDGQVFQAANVVGYKSGVYKDRNGNPYLILQSHNKQQGERGSHVPSNLHLIDQPKPSNAPSRQ